MDWLKSFRSLLTVRQPSASTSMAPKKRRGGAAGNFQDCPGLKKQKRPIGRAIQEHYELLAICFNSAALQLKDLAVISTCSKVCRSQVQLYLQHNVTLLLHAVKQASLMQLPQTAVKWFCSMAGLEAIQKQQRDLVCAANVFPAAAAHLLDAGLQISYQQLLLAARQRVPGFEVWVRSHFSGLPTIAEALCTHNVVEFKQLLPTLQPQELMDCLYLATNIRPSTAPSHPNCAMLLLEQIMAESPASLQLQHSLTPAQLEQLLTTAILRSHEFSYLAHLSSLPAANSLSTPAVTALLRLAVNSKSYLAVRILTTLHAAQSVAVAAASGMVLTTIHGRDPSTLTELRDYLPAARHLSSADLAGLLWVALPLSSSGGVCDALCMFPAADSISHSTLTSMMKAAMGQQKCALVEALCRRQSAADITPAAVADLILHSLQTEVTAAREFGGSGDRCTHVLCQLPSAQLLQPAAVAELLRAAMQSRDEDAATEVVCQLCQLPGAHALVAADVASLLKVAVQSSDVDVFVELCTLPAAASLLQSEVVVILQLCLELRQRYKLQLLLGTEPAQRLDAAGVATLLASATQMHHQIGYCSCGGTHCGSGLLERICELPGSQGITATAAAGLLRIAAQLEDDRALQMLCNKLPAVKSLDGKVVGSLLQDIVDRGGRLGPAVEVLCQLPGAAQLSALAVADLICSAEQQSNACVRSSLYKLYHKKHVM